MKKTIKSIAFLAVYNLTRSAMLKMEDKMRKEDRDSKDFKSKAMILGTIYTALGILYND